MNVAQQILALDARYNAYRAPNNPQHRKLNFLSLYRLSMSVIQYRLSISKILKF